MLKGNGRSEPIRVVVVDDSPTARDLLMAILGGAEGIQVVGSGADGEQALRLVHRLRPDVVTMDIRMPKMDGLEATRRIMREVPTPIVIVASSLMRADTDLAFEALKVGALAAVAKPGLHDPETCDKVIQAVRLMADVPVVHHWGRAEVGSRKPEVRSQKSEIGRLQGGKSAISNQTSKSSALPLPLAGQQRWRLCWGRCRQIFRCLFWWSSTLRRALRLAWPNGSACRRR
jgi:two-component system chemotaxis response regulator CheB